MNEIFLFIDRVKEFLLRQYRRRVFIAKIKSRIMGGVQVYGKVYVNAINIKVGKNVNIYPGVYFWGDGAIIIGDNVDIGVGTIIYSKKLVKIGNNVAIAGQCYIIDSNHSIDKDYLIRDQPMDVAEDGVIIGDDVWIGAGSKIIKGANIDSGVVIGAMSLVNSYIPKWSIAYGIPAKVIKSRK